VDSPYLTYHRLNSRQILQQVLFTDLAGNLMAVHTRTSSGPSFAGAFLGCEAEHIDTPHEGGNIYSSYGNSRMIAQYLEHNHYYNSNPTDDSRILNWLWPQAVGSSETSATAGFSRQNVMHRSSTEAKKSPNDPWLITRREYKEWLTGGSLWLRGKGMSFPGRYCTTCLQCKWVVAKPYSSLQSSDIFSPFQQLGSTMCVLGTIIAAFRTIPVTISA
jgi:hypothetical protein